MDSEDPRLNANKGNMNLVKAVIVGGLWPRIAKVVLPKAMFDKIAAGSQQREHQAKEVKYFDQREGRVFLHPSSVLFSQTTYKSRFLAYFTKVHTSKVFLRDVTEVCAILQSPNVLISSLGPVIRTTPFRRRRSYKACNRGCFHRE